MIEEPSRRWPVYVEIRDTVRAILAPALALAHLLRNGRRIAQRLREPPRRRKMQRSRLANIFKRN